MAEANNWAEGGTYRTALHAAAGALGGGLAGAAGATVSAVSMPAIADMIEKIDAPQAVKQALEQVAAAALGAAVGGTQGLASSVNVEVNNRQLHPDEKTRIRQLAQGDAKKEERLTAAACAAVRCWQEYAPGTLEDDNAKAMGDWGNSETLATERAEIERERVNGPFNYSLADIGSDIALLTKNTVVQLLDKAAWQVKEMLRNGPNALPQTPPDLPDDTSGPSGSAGAVVTLPVATCAPRVGCVVSPPVVIPGNVYASAGSGAGNGGSGSSDDSGGGSDGANTAATDAGAAAKPTVVLKPTPAPQPLTYADVRQTVNANTTPFGKSGNAYNVSSETDLNALYNDLTVGASPTTANSYSGSMGLLPDGTRVGLRNASTTGGATIDVFPAAGKPYKVHIAP